MTSSYDPAGFTLDDRMADPLTEAYRQSLLQEVASGAISRDEARRKFWAKIAGRVTELETEHRADVVDALAGEAFLDPDALPEAQARRYRSTKELLTTVPPVAPERAQGAISLLWTRAMRGAHYGWHHDADSAFAALMLAELLAVLESAGLDTQPIRREWFEQFAAHRTADHTLKFVEIGRRRVALHRDPEAGE